MARTKFENYKMYCIKIRESVYDNAVKGQGSSLGFIFYEICHFILIHLVKAGPLVYKEGDELVYARSFNNNELICYESMEWQAQALCIELMIPYDVFKYSSFEEIIEKTNSSKVQTECFLKWIANK